MKKAILLFIIMMSLLSEKTFSASFEEIRKLSELEENTPYAVRYQVLEDSKIGKAIQKRFKEGEISKKEPFAALYYKGIFIYSSDGSGNIRYDFSTFNLPVDFRETPLPPANSSLYLSPDKLIRKQKGGGGRFYQGATIIDKERINDELYRFPLFGLGVKSRVESDGVLSLRDAVIRDFGETPGPDADIDQAVIFVEDEACTVTIKWGDETVPASIFYDYEGESGGAVYIEETAEKDGFIYPRKARWVQKINRNSLLRIVEIQVLDFRTGHEAMESYPATPPSYPESFFQDLREKSLR